MLITLPRTASLDLNFLKVKALKPVFLKKILVAILFSSLILFSATTVRKETIKPQIPYSEKERQWVDSVFNALTPDERLGQLFMVAAYSDSAKADIKGIETLINTYHIGGIIFFQGTPLEQAQLTNHYQSLAKVPLLIGMDAEWGLSMRLDSTVRFPYAMTLGAIRSNEAILRMSAEVARQCKRLGVQINFAPVVDINSNPRNPVIGYRSFGEDKLNVAAKGVAYMRGFQSNSVLAVAKHFPGHGDTDADSHQSLPILNKTLDQLEQQELFPFRRLIQDTLRGLMVGHLAVPSFEKGKIIPSTLSKSVVTDLLKEQIGFPGLVFTDALNMKAVTKLYKPGDIEAMAIQAGNDVLLFPENVPEAVARVKKALKGKNSLQNDVDVRVKKILATKYWTGLHARKPIETESLNSDLNKPEIQAINEELYEQAITVVKNTNILVPLVHLDTTTFACVSIGLPKGNTFQEIIGNYTTVANYAIADKDTSEVALQKMIKRLSQYKVVIISLHDLNNLPGQAYGIRASSRSLIERLRTKTNVVLAVFGTPYSLKYFEKVNTLLCAYEDNEITRRLVPQVLFGALGANGRLPVTASEALKVGTGVITTSIARLGYSVPERVGMKGETLEIIDKICLRAIEDHTMPGCQVLVAKDGKVIFDKAYGYMTYDTLEPVSKHTIYDLASVTKVSATLQAIMFLHERGILDVNQKVSAYLPELAGTNKENILVRDVLMHQAGLVAFQSHWDRTITRQGWLPEYYSPEKSDKFNVEVTPGMYGTTSMRDSIWKWTIGSRLLHKPAFQEKYNFEYSDVSFYILHKIAERLLNQPIDQFLKQNFYDPLGADELLFNPLCTYGQECIAPTERDVYFRRSLIRGTVHDQGAAMMGGVAGHAGLFGTANDLAILMQMNLQKGYYGGRRYFQDNTLPTFTRSYNKGNRRGLGWDRPRNDGGGSVSEFASKNSFGHTGFTGTIVWVDPDENLVYIFLSNRVYPNPDNNKLARYGIRKRIQDWIYKSISNYQIQTASIKQ
ncbi:glycoside hydrolase family 3 N-terminal domain-containing protein [Cytophagaceae bacterium BD1B2-1]|uniref:beta-N-acetylhexosaminidase n=1 Tax=Xanthocytophaga agilis TaxID=3048010 RepID=A0AAE3RAU2_9BACT|nr:glycoside hydrolase family 3 N-terminal domain-containing protein [Xanthocytophaga agilis]